MASLMKRTPWFGTLAVLLAACGGSQPPIGEPGAMPQSSALASHADRGTSWMLPEAKSEDLLYVTNYDDVLVFSYPQGKLVGTLKSFYSNVGECVDSDGNVYVASSRRHTAGLLSEYAHGNPNRVVTLSLKKVDGVGCSVDPTTGNVAVSGFSSYVDIFPVGKKIPLVVKDPRMTLAQFCAYDGKGDLFVNGEQLIEQPHTKWVPLLSELPKTSRKFIDIKLDAPIDYEGNIDWDGSHLAALAYIPPHARVRKPVIFQFDINGGIGKKVGVTPLDKPAEIVLQYTIVDNTVIAPNLSDKEATKPGVLTYDYPAGGQPRMELTNEHLRSPRGVALSLAPK